MLCSKILNTGIIAKFISSFSAIQDALSKVHAVYASAVIQIVYILRRRIGATNANRIGTIFATIWTLIIAWTTTLTVSKNSSALRQASAIRTIIIALNECKFAFIFTYLCQFLITEMLLKFYCVGYKLYGITYKLKLKIDDNSDRKVEFSLDD